jgi:hypothetical protein
LTQVSPAYSKSRVNSSTSNVSSFHRGHGYSLLNQAEEEFPTGLRSPSIESEGIFIKIIVQMRCTYRSLMSALQPPLQQCRHSIHQRQQVFTYIRRWTDNDVLIVGRGQRCVAEPTVGAYDTPWLDTSLYRRYQTCRRSIGHSTKPNSPDVIAFIFNCYKNQRLTGCTSPSFSRPFATDINFVNLDSARQAISARSHHGSTKLMEPYPYGFISLEPQNSLESHGADSILLTDYVPNRAKPKLKRFSSILKDGPCRHRGFGLTSCAMVQVATGYPRPVISTTRTSKTFRPSKVDYIFQAHLLGVKPLFKFH